MVNLELWFLFPVAVFISTIAMTCGIGGAVMYSPFFMIAMKLEPTLALGASLVIEFFSFLSGVFGYVRKKLVNFEIIKKLGPFTVFGTVFGLILGVFISELFIILLIVGIMIFLSFDFLYKGRKWFVKHHKVHDRSHFIGLKNGLGKIGLDNKIFGFFGGSLVGLSSVGLGEVNEYNFLEKMKMSVANASGTSVFLVMMSAFIGGFGHLYFLVSNNGYVIFEKVLSILIFAVPGSLIGSWFGVRIVQKIDVEEMEIFVGVLFLFLGVLMAVSYFF